MSEGRCCTEDCRQERDCPARLGGLDCHSRFWLRLIGFVCVGIFAATAAGLLALP
jgi:hypothetical protein